MAANLVCAQEAFLMALPYCTKVVENFGFLLCFLKPERRRVNRSVDGGIYGLFSNGRVHEQQPSGEVDILNGQYAAPAMRSVILELKS
jgi:hypothetical protein